MPSKEWEHDFDVKRVGVGFINNWGGLTFTLKVDSLSIEYQETEPIPETIQWCRLKENE